MIQCRLYGLIHYQIANRHNHTHNTLKTYALLHKYASICEPVNVVFLPSDVLHANVVYTMTIMSVHLSVTRLSCVKTAKRIELVFGMYGSVLSSKVRSPEK